MDVDVRFYAELNDFLAPARRGTTSSFMVGAGTTVKDLVESLGVPHTEVDVILVNGEPVGFSHRLLDGDRVSVYPVFESLDVAPVAHLRPRPLRRTRFVLDVHLGKLARDLRLLGFDARWANEASDEGLVATSLGEHRILLTRDRGILKRAAVTHGYLVRETLPRRQTVEVLNRFDLFGAVAPFGRCLACNGRTAPVAKDEVLDRLPPRTRRDYDDFRRCADCGRIYWRGSHYDRLRARVAEILEPAPGGRSSLA